ncbi:stage II sporulation protein D [Paenibacillus polymyxa]|uniref:stage II sporulation protein D n=1 Tax=Paenibacillus polymyxa TaxID=1406 RepID=UPI0025B6A25D|nr:stage II sporulation protein D [Paenibacillus polymyxa]MDN4081825.1 stage II sporulation protein D [Paenibacillus polymyxa]MDN4088943.1 stage II sporulation protein D [Paenibacillus polymyxa]MDN4109320.1 stage II sporulation protein D [Paenibacillus polymyxa]
MKDSQVRIRIPIHHPKEHRQASLAKESSGSIATSLQKNKLMQQQPGTTGALPPIAKTHRRTTALTSTIHTVGAMLPDTGTAPGNTYDASRRQGPQPHLRPVAGRAPRWGSRRPWLPFAAMAGVLVLAMAVPALMAWPRQAVQPLPSGSRTAAPAQPNTAAKSEAPVTRLPGVPPMPAVPAAPARSVPAAAEPDVRVYVTSTGRTETLPLEQYIVGVVAAEMPPSFEEEALKAQAIAARTFITRRLLADDTSGAPAGADVTDTVKHQAYISKAKLTREWEHSGKSADLTKIRQAVRDTKDTIMVYDGKPITASFFSTSNGYTENSEDVWAKTVPYLRSVSSPWDKQLAPRFTETVTLSRQSVFDRLGLSRAAVTASTGGGSMPEIRILSKTEGHRIKKIEVGGSVFTGPEIRNKLGLRSAEFTWKTEGDRIAITTYGYGHGVGMSQWGANGMAKEGHTATQILLHYYTGISFANASRILS